MTSCDADLSRRFRPVPRPAWLPEHTWPFQSYGVETDDSVLAVTEAGQGPALLLAHVGAWSFIWRDLVTLLAPDFRCIFFDAPGNGLTEGRSRGVTLESAAEAVEAVIQALDLRDFTMVVHDLGGPAGLGALARVPERARGIVAMNAFAWTPSGAAFRGMLGLMGSRPMREFDVLTGFLPRLSSTWFGVGRHMDEASRQAFLAGMGVRGRRAFHDYLHDASRCEGLYRRIARAVEGPLGNVPLLSVFGERNDPFGFQQRWKEWYPTARQVMVPKGNHFPMCDAPDLVARTIREWHGERVARSIRSGAPSPDRHARL